MTRFYDKAARAEVTPERVTEPGTIDGVSIGHGDWILTPGKGEAYGVSADYYEANVIVYDTVPVVKPADVPVVKSGRGSHR